ncbi:non-specific lipid transfer protein GPI-anchored 14-like [Diospyros lotus]|uniref:non-specific lipid transfer protein GPI-anchored 14-like n=1 Tax=Diospyros lotus TaxID=55363 RepID=UPI0022547B1C|nr:non-specific lipid transfer protein GPI-anchored 14-like [Diospyros lotus]
MDLHFTRKGSFPVILVAAILMAWMFSCGSSGTDKDKEECTQQLVGMATCLPYVEGNAKAPTPDCCSGLKQVLKANKKCLCVIIKDRNDPDLGLTINVTLALGLPSACNAPANVSQCPALLHLPPNSPDAQVFYQFGNASNGSSPAKSPTSASVPSVKDKPTSASSTGASGVQPNSGKRWMGLQGIVNVVGLLLCFFYSSHLFL